MIQTPRHVAQTDNAAITSASNALVQDPRFDASDRLKRLLVYLSESSQSGNHKISQAEIAQDVMELGPDFDPKIDAHVRIEVGRLRKALTLHYARFGNDFAAHLHIPKGSYRPEIVNQPSTSKLQTPVSDSSGENPVAIFTAVTCGPGASADLAEMTDMIAAEVRGHSFASPLVRARLMRIPIHADVAYDRVRDMARAVGAPMAALVRLHQGETEFRIFMELRDVASDDVLISQRKVFATSQPMPEIIRRMARSVACFLCDPMLGTVPQLVARKFGDNALQSVLSAYSFVSSQNLSVLPQVLTGLESLASSQKSTPTVKGLLAEISRVSGRLQNDHRSEPVQRYLEQAEEAITEDTGDITCRLALGFARLDAGLIQAALDTGRSIMLEQAPTSLAYKARVLVALADTEGQYRDLLINDPIDEDAFFFMKEFSQIIPKIRWNDIMEADRMMSGSLHSNIFWLHLFHTAVLIEAGDKARAERTAHRVSLQVPNSETVLPRLVRSFFPKENERAYLMNGLRAAGLKVQI